MKNWMLLAAGILVAGTMNAQDAETRTNKEGSSYEFTVVHDLEATGVQNQCRTGTCWSYSTLSYLESEMIRMGNEPINLAEMFIARQAYQDKAENYVRMHGKHNFGAGGAFHDNPLVIKKYGILPEEVYKGLNYGTDVHNHSELDAILTATVNAIIENPQKTLTPSWKNAISGVLDAYLGEVPEKFEYKGKEYTPESFAASIGLNMDDYIYLSSFTHHPFYEQFVMEVPDNWAFGLVYNVPLDEMMESMEHALETGYSFAWASDISEKGFAFRQGLAIVPQDDAAIAKQGKDNKHFSDAGADKKGNQFMNPGSELEITQEMRQIAFDNYQTTDDHGMHVTGMVKDQDGTKYFAVKNSWGSKHNDLEGYFYASEAFAAYKTIDIMLHKDALSKDLKKKLGIK